MKFKQSCFLIVIIVFAFANSYAQQKRPVILSDKPRNLKIGEVVPDIFIAKVINDVKVSFNISNFKNQLLIFDFWSTTCSACIEGLPRMHALQQQFGDQIKILPVTYEPETTIVKFMQRNRNVKDLNIPSVVADKVLSKWFRHQGMPHEVWIYKNKVIAITGAEYVDENNIRSVLNGKIPKMPVKDDFYKYDYKKHFLVQEKAHQNNENKQINYVAVTGYQEGAKFSFATQKDSISGHYRTYLINYPILRAYITLSKNLNEINLINSAGMGMLTGGVSPNQFILEVKDKNRYLYNSTAKDYQESWERKYDISYEWVSSDTAINAKERSLMIVNDLDRFLHLNGRWEKRVVKCLVLVRTNSVDRIKSSGGERIFEYKGNIKKLRNSNLSNLVYYLNSFHENPPVFDGTGYRATIDINLDFNLWTDIPAIRKTLQQYGLDLKEEKRELDMFVLTETDRILDFLY